LKNLLIQYKFYVLLLLCIVFGCAYYFFIYQPNPSTNQTISQLEKNTQSNVDEKIKTEPKEELKPKVETIMIDVKGEIKKPGVYQSNQGERVIDVINQAGGLTDKADESQINFAAHVQDEMVVYIPAKGEISANFPPDLSSLPSTATGSSQKTNKINLNKADETELQNLPGIGPSKAASIISYRNENGPFQSIDDLKNISGIGDKTFEKLKESIMVQ
jgi:competence protein ComEA